MIRFRNNMKLTSQRRVYGISNWDLNDTVNVAYTYTKIGTIQITAYSRLEGLNLKGLQRGLQVLQRGLQVLQRP